MKDTIIKLLLRIVVWGLVVALATAGVVVVARLIQRNPVYFFQQVVNGLQLGFVYALIALGYTMIYGVVKLINFAHGDVFMVGGFVSFYAITRYRLHLLPASIYYRTQDITPTPEALAQAPGWTMIIGTVLVILLAMIICGFLNVIIERVAYKPLRNAPRIAALITAIGVSFFLEYFTALGFVFGPDYYTYIRPMPVTSWNIGGVAISNILVIIIVSTIFLLVLLQYIVMHTKMGKAMRASSFDKSTARLMGINVDMVISFTFALGAVFAGAAGVLYAIAYPQIITFVGIRPGLKAFVAAVLGGIGNIPGAFVGSLIMGLAEAMTIGFFSVTLPGGEVLAGSTLRDAIVFAVLILVFLIRPTGIFGEPEGEKA